jgi:REP element-mobilizing transposase RayT
MAAWRILPNRRRIRLPAAAYREGDLYLITICAAEKRPRFDDPRLADLVVEALREHLLPDGGPIVAYCLMPEHLHALLMATRELLEWVRVFKATVSGRAHRLGLADGLWQRSFHDRHIPPIEQAVREVIRYMLDNPVRRGLVETWDAWPYSWVAWAELVFFGSASGGSWWTP